MTMTTVFLRGNIVVRKSGCQTLTIETLDDFDFTSGFRMEITLDQAIEISNFVNKNAVKTIISRSGKELK